MKNISVSTVIMLLGVAAFCLTVFFVAANNRWAFGDLALSDVAPAVLGAILWPVVAAVVACVALRYLNKGRSKYLEFCSDNALEYVDSFPSASS